VKFSIKEIIAILLALGGLGTGGLALGAFATTNPDAVVPGLPFLALFDGIISKIPPFSFVGNAENATSRGFAYMGLAVVMTSLAAMLFAPTRAETVPVIGRKGA
jgi:hypothetical protein